jgi:hypothetical protein
MADVSTYRRATMSFAYSGSVIHEGDLRPASDGAVTTNPQWWAAMTDSDMTDSNISVPGA